MAVLSGSNWIRDGRYVTPSLRPAPRASADVIAVCLRPSINLLSDETPRRRTEISRDKDAGHAMRHLLLLLRFFSRVASLCTAQDAACCR